MITIQEHILWKHKRLGGTVSKNKRSSSGKEMTKEEVRALAAKIEARGGKELGRAIRSDVDRSIRRVVENF